MVKSVEPGRVVVISKASLMDALLAQPRLIAFDHRGGYVLATNF